MKQDRPVLPKRVWVVTKADDPNTDEPLASCKVLGAYLTKAVAQQVVDGFVEQGRWQAGYSYHQGEDAESIIEVKAAALHA